VCTMVVKKVKKMPTNILLPLGTNKKAEMIKSFHI